MNTISSMFSSLWGRAVETVSEDRRTQSFFQDFNPYRNKGVYALVCMRAR